jgi:hypothetical protein
MSNVDFVHSALPQGNATRILSLLPGAFEDLVCCTTTPQLLAKAPPYNALSYTWGTEEDNKVVEVNGQPFTIRNNLWCFLRRIRKADASLTLWCDMVCIDQNNSEERGHQVQFMGEIYRNAACVWIWLGEEAEGTARIFDLLSGINAVKVKLGREYHKKWKALVLRKVRERYSLSKREDVERLVLPALVEITTREYWDRVWILQEVALAQYAIIHSGNCALELQAFFHGMEDCFRLADPYMRESTVVRWLTLKSPRPMRGRCRRWFASRYREKYGDALASDQRTAARTIAYMWEKQQIRRPCALSYLLTVSVERRCSNMRDKVYGVLAMARDMKELVVDYSSSTGQLFVAVLELMTGDVENYPTVVSNLARALDVDAETVHYAIIESGDALGRSYRYVMSTPASIIGVQTCGTDSTKVITDDPTPRSDSKEFPFTPTKQRDLKLITAGTNVEIGDQIAQLFFVHDNLQILPLDPTILSQQVASFEAAPYCVLRRKQDVLESIAFVLPEQHYREQVDRLWKQKVADFYATFRNFDLENMKIDDELQMQTLLLHRRQHLLYMTLHLKEMEYR